MQKEYCLKHGDAGKKKDGSGYFYCYFCRQERIKGTRVYENMPIGTYEKFDFTKWAWEE